ncbi:MAG: hypothetical protein CMM01_01535 [Rhodopirellula sp.]|nr:hypothetical protein [Rhodopirellula sp.]
MNESQITDFLIQWSIRVSVILVYLRILIRLWRGGPEDVTQRSLEYYVWAGGFLMLVAHVCLSFHFVHHWLHSDAWTRTSTETENLIGVRSGNGIWANYLLLAIWGIDLLRLNRAKAHGRITNRSVDRAVAFFFCFMFVNATVVFGPTVYRYLAFPALTLLLCVWRLGKR